MNYLTSILNQIIPTEDYVLETLLLSFESIHNKIGQIFIIFVDQNFLNKYNHNASIYSSLIFKKSFSFIIINLIEYTQTYVPETLQSNVTAANEKEIFFFAFYNIPCLLCLHLLAFQTVGSQQHSTCEYSCYGHASVQKARVEMNCFYYRQKLHRSAFFSLSVIINIPRRASLLERT